MPMLDIAMPIALFSVVVAALFLNDRVEDKLKSTVQETEFRPRDVILLVASMAIVITVITLTATYNPLGLFDNVFITFFMIAYSVLLFTFGYIFSNGKKSKVQVVSAFFGVVNIVFAAVSLIGPVADEFAVYRFAAFMGLGIFCFAALLIDQKRGATSKERWYVAVQPAALFILIFVFFNSSILYDGVVRLWNPYLLDVFAFTFALLIILYLSSLFNWKTVVLFAGLLTVLDVILVFTGPMVKAANTFTGVGLPVLVWLPKIPLIYGTDIRGNTGLLFSGLGLGDFFFAGILSIQTLKKFGKKIAYISAVVIAVAFGIWEFFLPDIDHFFNIGGFPATVCIITGWLPVVAIAFYLQRRKEKNVQSTPTSLTVESTSKP